MDEESSDNNRKKSKYNREIDDFELELEKVLLEADDDQCTHSIRLGNLCCNCGKEIKTTINKKQLSFSWMGNCRCKRRTGDIYRRPAGP